MCTGAIINARIKRVFFGAYDLKSGSCGSVTNLFDFPYNHKSGVTGGLFEEECSALLSSFFRDLRHKNDS
ncbi:tRNA-specific adenosine deaminase [bioreactor metagenome]|uniref:tRNA-specific adenosine deaminase n=1 Tax=bioreactor metagenome TaxID=1076179 RepID=A0A645BSZ7_9ZZZZ